MRSTFRLGVLFYFCFSISHFYLFAEINEDQKDEIRKIVFEHLFKNNESVLQNTAAAYCVSIEGERDPSRKLIEKLRKAFPLVKIGSDCELAPSVDGGKSDPVGYVVDKKTKKKAILFEIQEIQSKGASEVIVVGSYSEYSLSSATHRITLKKEKSKWKVAEDKIISIA
ncbi:hypothetical protein L0244_38895 [bacterium]|nr:hypothetical protein [bacterium]MCI0618979.1 hypothetical protein [bacterium]